MALLLSAPPASASFSDVRTWERHIAHESDSNGVVAQFNHVVVIPHGFSTTARESTWTVDATYTTQDPAIGTATVTFTLEIDGGDLCSWSVTRTAIVGLVQEVGHTFNIKCLNATAVNAGTHSLEIKTSGTSPVVSATTSVGLRQLDTITDATLEPLATTAGQLTQHEATRTLINATTATLQGEHVIMGLWPHCEQTTNATNDCEGIKLNFTSQFLGKNLTCVACFETVSTMSILELPGMTDQQSGAILIFLIMLVVSYFQRWLFVAIAAVIGILDLMFRNAQGPAPVFGFEFTLLLLVIALVLQVLVDMRDARKEKQGEADDGNGSS